MADAQQDPIKKEQKRQIDPLSNRRGIPVNFDDIEPVSEDDRDELEAEPEDGDVGFGEDADQFSDPDYDDDDDDNNDDQSDFDEEKEKVKEKREKPDKPKEAKEQPETSAEKNVTNQAEKSAVNQAEKAAVGQGERAAVQSAGQAAANTAASSATSGAASTGAAASGTAAGGAAAGGTAVGGAAAGGAAAGGAAAGGAAAGGAAGGGAAVGAAAWPIVLAIIIIILVIVIAIVIYAVFFRNANSGASGSTPTQAVNPIKDVDWVKQAALLTGDNSLKKEIASDSVTDLKNNLTSISSTTTNVANKNKIETMIVKLNQLQSNPTDTVQTEVIDQLEDIFDILENPMPVFTGRNRKPLNNTTGYNSELHFKSALNPDSSDYGHTPYFEATNCDAVDIYTDGEADVYSPLVGKVESVTDDGSGYQKIVIKNGDYEILIANISASVSAGDNITISTIIGKTVSISGFYQVHLEAAYCGACVVTTKYDQYLSKLSGEDIGAYLWKHIARILNIE